MAFKDYTGLIGEGLSGGLKFLEVKKKEKLLRHKQILYEQKD